MCIVRIGLTLTRDSKQGNNVLHTEEWCARALRREAEVGIQTWNFSSSLLLSSLEVSDKKVYEP